MATHKNSHKSSWRTSRRPKILTLQLVATLLVVKLSASSMELFSVKFIEHNGSRLIATSNSNYAISSPKLATRNWRTVSVNGDSSLAISTTGERIPTTRSQLAAADLSFIENLRDDIASGTGGYTHSSTAAGTDFGSSTGVMVSDSSTSSSSMSSSSYSSSTKGANSRGELSYNMRDSNNFSVARSDLPFNWSRVFFNDDLVTLVYRDGIVQMLPVSQLDAAQSEAVQKLRAEVGDMQRNQAQTMQNSMNMVSSVFNSIMNQFPKPPSYESAVGGMFGNNFPFGPNNSPFDSASGWPFGGGTGAMASAFAGRRRR